MEPWHVEVFGYGSGAKMQRCLHPGLRVEFSFSEGLKHKLHDVHPVIFNLIVKKDLGAGAWPCFSRKKEKVC